MKSRLESERFSRSNVHVRGFVDNVDVYMDACDVVITKPGGLTVSETLVKRKPLILTNPIPGVEDENADYLVNYGLAMRATRNISVAELINNLFTYPGLMERMHGAIEAFACTNATQKLSDFILNMK
jgi:processive 1,2-diacylglycerol beta-glucosyltransferase